MSRRSCVLPYRYTSEQAKCSRHPHHKLSHCLALEQRGELIRLDVEGRRFVEAAPLVPGVERTFEKYPRPALPALHALTSPAARRTRNKQIQRTFRRNEMLGARIIDVPFLTFDDEDVYSWSPSAPGALVPGCPWPRRSQSVEIELIGIDGEPTPRRGKPVRAAIRRRTAEAATRVEMCLAKFWPSEPVMVTSTNLGDFFPVFADLRLRQIAVGKDLLVQVWKEVVVQLRAGKFTRPLNDMSPEDLPLVVVHRVLDAYLCDSAAPQELPI